MPSAGRFSFARVAVTLAAVAGLAAKAEEEPDRAKRRERGPNTERI